MKNACCLLVLLLSLLPAAGCSAEAEPVLYLGLDAEVTDMDAENQILYVTDLGDEVFGENRAIGCGSLLREKRLIYVDYETHEVTQIEFSDLRVGDHVIISVYEDQLPHASGEAIEVEQIQLVTQRLN